MMLLTLAYLYKRYGHKFPFNKLGKFIKVRQLAFQPVAKRNDAIAALLKK
jgi:hypothetical protein